MRETIMRLLFKQRFFSWFDSYDIYDEHGGTVFVVKGQLSWGHKLQIYDQAGNHIGMVKERVLTWLPKFEMYVGDNYIGEIKKELTFLKPRFTLDYQGWRVSGDVWSWNYEVKDQAGQLIMTASKQIWNLTDTYIIDVVNSEHSVLALMIVLAIDAAKCTENSRH